MGVPDWLAIRERGNATNGTVPSRFTHLITICTVEMGQPVNGDGYDARWLHSWAASSCRPPPRDWVPWGEVSASCWYIRTVGPSNEWVDKVGGIRNLTAQEAVVILAKVRHLLHRHNSWNGTINILYIQLGPPKTPYPLIFILLLCLYPPLANYVSFSTPP